jgi:hypothetical protein
MSIMDRMSTLWSSRDEEPATGAGSTLTLAELEDQGYRIAFLDDTPGEQFAIATPRGKISTSELGTSSASPFTSFTREEYNVKLQGLRGLEAYDKMRKSDGTVRGTLRAIKTPVLSGRWFLEPVDDTDESRKIAEFIWCNLTEYMTITWPQVMQESMLMLDFGYWMWEKVWENRVIDGETRTVLAKLGPRHPMDVERWFKDANGGPAGVRMNIEVTERYPEGYADIPIEKLLVFTFDREAGNIEGISVLRSAYKHWYYKEQLYKIDAIQKERHGIGIPVIKLPVGFTDEDKRLAQELGRNIRTNERAHIVLPPNWEIAMLKLEGQPVNALESIEHHNGAIRENILVNFIGEMATRDEDLVMFMKAVRFIADIFASSINTYLIPEMVKYNFPGVEKFPKLKVRRIGEVADWRTLSFAYRNLIGAGVIIPDDTLEENIREEMDLPAADRDTARLVATPQNPFDVVEELDDEEGDDNGIDDRAGEGSAGENTHNKNNPNYNRSKLRKRSRTGKARGGVAGMPRQTPTNKARGSFGTGNRSKGGDRSGG